MMNKFSAIIFLLIPFYASADLKSESLGGATLNVTFEVLRESLLEEGWKVGPNMNGKRLQVIRRENNNQYSLIIDFHYVAKEKRTKKIIYTVDYTSEVVNTDAIKSQLTKKYGMPYRESNATGFLVMGFSDVSGTVLSKRNVGALCRDEMIKNGTQTIAAIARGAADMAIHLGGWLENGYDVAEELCPDTLPEFEKYIARELAPHLEALVGTGTNGKGKVSRTLLWEYPSRILEREKNIAEQKKSAARPEAKLD